MQKLNYPSTVGATVKIFFTDFKVTKCNGEELFEENGYCY